MADNLHPCQACGLPVANKAKKCPHCGYKNKKNRPVFLLVLIFIVVIIAVGFLKGKNSASVKSPDPTGSSTAETAPATESTADTTVESTTETTADAATETTEAPSETTESTEASAETEPQLVDGMRPGFKEAMDSYEAFYIEYCDFMKKYNEDPTNPLLLVEYMQIISKAEQANIDLEKWDEASMNNTELRYYMDVTGRVAKMLLDVAG